MPIAALPLGFNLAEATARVGRVIERELVQLGASAANLSPRKRNAVRASASRPRTWPRTRAKEAEITRVLAKVSTEDMVVLRCLVGEDRAAQASRYIALKGLRLMLAANGTCGIPGAMMVGFREPSDAEWDAGIVEL